MTSTATFGTIINGWLTFIKITGLSNIIYRFNKMSLKIATKLGDCQSGSKVHL